MKGSVLNVGVHDFNKNDGICFPDKELYSTIDLIEDNKKYGSQYNHITGDILNINIGSKFDNIILFGVLNIPSGNYGNKINKADYTLYNKEKELMKKIDEILSINGRVLFGPDIPKSIKENALIVDKYYSDFFDSNEIIKANYISSLKYIGRGNILYEYIKIK